MLIMETIHKELSEIAQRFKELDKKKCFCYKQRYK